MDQMKTKKQTLSQLGTHDLQLQPSPQTTPNGEEKLQKYVLHSEKEPYDFVAHRIGKKSTNIIQSTGHIIKGCLGGGILGIHEAFMNCGLWTSLVVTAACGICITYCVHILVKSAQTLYKRLHLPEMSYPDVAEASLAVGPFPGLRKYSSWFRYAVDLSICISMFGACCVYQIIIANTIQELAEGQVQESQTQLNRIRFYILALLFPTVLLCMIRTLKYLAPFSLVADAFIVICVVATIVYSMQVAPPISEMPAWKNALGFFKLCGVVVFSMDGVGVFLPVENNMKSPEQFPVVLWAAMTVVTAFLILVGFFGYWGFGEDCRSPVTLNFPSETFPSILKGLVALMIFTTFAVNFWAPFNLVWHYMSRYHDQKKHWIWERAYRGIFVVLITLVAITFPTIANLMGLLGAICLSSLGLIYPAIIELLVIWESPGLGRFKWKLWKNIVICIIGVVVLVAGTYSSVKAIMENS